MAQIHGGQIVARALKAEGVDAVFTLTGGHILGVLDGCVQEGIRVVDVRHEQSAGHAAEAYTGLTGRLGVALVTAGPGVTDTITAVATAFYANTPLLVIGGRHMIRQQLKGGLQEMDHTRLFHSITKWAATAWQVDRLAEYVATAARHAFSGRGGPVFLDIPMDVQFDMVEETAVRMPQAYRSESSSGRRRKRVESDRLRPFRRRTGDGLCRSRVPIRCVEPTARVGRDAEGPDIRQQPGPGRAALRPRVPGQSRPFAGDGRS